MSRQGSVRVFPPLQLLSEGDIVFLKRESLEVLEEPGVRIEHKPALDLLRQYDCRVDYEAMRVHIPPSVAEECLRRCPSTFAIRARDPSNDVVMGGNVTYFKTSSGMQTVDLNTWEPRVATRRENYEGVTVLDALPNLDMLGPYVPYYGFARVPPCMAMPESFAARIRVSSKVPIEGSSHGSEVFQLEMAAAVGTEIMVQITASPPLTWHDQAIEALFRVVRAGCPIAVVGGQTFGATAPATIAGALITNNAELLAAIVLAQLIRPGTRVLADDFAFAANMRSGAPAFGDIATALHQASFNQLWGSWGLPVYNPSCGYISSKVADFQAGYEKGIQALAAALSGANLIGLHGAISAELTAHPVQAILDDDVAGMVKRLLNGVQVTPETTATDLIRLVGPIPGHYLNTAHTRKWWRHEQYTPVAADRLTYPEWSQSGRRTCLDYARQRMEEILATHNPVRLSTSQETEVERILQEARNYYRRQGAISTEEDALYADDLRSSGYPYR